MTDERLIEVVNDYLSTASEEEKTKFIEAHRKLEYFYLDKYLDNEEYSSLSDFFAKLSGSLDEMAEEVGYEDNRAYYDRICKELRQKHKQQVHANSEVKEYATVEA